MGKKTPLKKIRGSLTRLEMVIILEGLSVGGVEKRVPNTAKHKADRITVTIKRNGLCSGASIIKRLMPMGTSERKTPNRNAANTSPASIAGSVNGAASKRSKVRVRVSKGRIAGVVAEAVKKSAIPIRPGTRLLEGTFLPMANAIKRNVGDNIPKMMTGPLR